MSKAFRLKIQCVICIVFKISPICFNILSHNPANNIIHLFVDVEKYDEKFCCSHDPPCCGGCCGYLDLDVDGKDEVVVEEAKAVEEGLPEMYVKPVFPEANWINSTCSCCGYCGDKCCACWPNC